MSLKQGCRITVAAPAPPTPGRRREARTDCPLWSDLAGQTYGWQRLTGYWGCPTGPGHWNLGSTPGAVHTVATGDSPLSPSVTRRVIDRMAQHPVPAIADQARLDALTPRERKVLELVARGLTNRECAAALTVEESTIRTHVKRILMKLDLRDRVQAVIFAYESSINTPGATRARR